MTIPPAYVLPGLRKAYTKPKGFGLGRPKLSQNDYIAVDPYTVGIIMRNSGYTVLIGAADFRRVYPYRWSDGPRGYARAWIGGRIVYLHNFLVGAEPSRSRKFANGDRRDCRRANLLTTDPIMK